MEDYKLDYDEVILVEPFRATLKKDKKYYHGSLMLTNKYLIWSRDPKGNFIFGKEVFSPEKIKIDQIKIYNGIPQIKIQNTEYDHFLIYLVSKTMLFVFYDIEDVQRLINETSKLLTGNAVMFESGNAIKGTEQIANKLAGTVNAFKNAFGVKPQQESYEPISKNCKSCGAQLTGIRGKTIKCHYCDTVQEL